MHEHREDDDQNDLTDFDPTLDYIDILGVSSDADVTEIKKRYAWIKALKSIINIQKSSRPNIRCISLWIKYQMVN